MAGVQPQRSNPPRMFTTDDEAYGQERLSFMFPRCMGAKAAVEHSGVATGFTRLVGRWNVRAIGRRRKLPWCDGFWTGGSPQLLA